MTARTIGPRKVWSDFKRFALSMLIETKLA